MSWVVGRVLSIFDGPDYVNLRKAGRAVIVCPLLVAFGLELIDNSTIALYSFFAGFVALVFSDYGGPPLRRAGAYCTALIGGVVVILLGAVLASSMIAAAIGLFVVMFLATFATAFGGYRALHVAPIALAYTMSALEPLSDLGVADRVAGWTLGCGVALIAALVMWPIDRRGGLQAAAAALAGDLGVSVRSLHDPEAARTILDRVRADTASLHAALATPLRPYGPTRRDVSFVHLVEHLVHAVEIVEELVVDGPSDEYGSVVAGIANSLERSGSMLAGSGVEVATDEEMHDLDRARVLGHDRLEREAARCAEEGEGVAAMLRVIPLLSLSHVVLWIEADASRVVGTADSGTPALSTAPEVRSAAPADDLRSRARRSVRVVRSELDPDGVILRNSFRAGVALAASIVVADLLPVEHGFWIVLATLLVLHSGAHSTYTTAVGAVVGTLIGIAIGVVLVLLFGDVTWLQWMLLPIVVFIAAYIPGVNFIAGQAAFGLLVIVLFEILDYPGTQTAVVRVETVATGAITATVLSFVLWPRGARAAIAASVAEVYRAAAAATSTFVRDAADRGLHASELIEADRRAEAAFAVALAEHSEPIDTAAWARVLAPSTLTRALVIGLVPTVDHEPAGCGHAVAVVDRCVDAASERLATVADVLAGHSREPSPFTSVDVGELEGCVDSCASSVEQMAQALLIVSWWAMLGRLIGDIDEASGALDDVTAASAPRAWLFGSTRGHSPS